MTRANVGMIMYSQRKHSVDSLFLSLCFFFNQLHSTIMDPKIEADV